MQMKNGTPVNDAVDMEREADVMGARAAALAALDRPATLQAFRAGSSMPVQRIKLDKKRLALLRQWVPDDIESSSEEYKSITAWFTKATQLSGVDVDWIVTTSFDSWYGDEAGFANTDPASVTVDAFRAIGAAKAASSKPSDPLAEVHRKVKGEGLKPSDFTKEELLTIQSGSGSGWGQAIRSVNEQRLQRLENMRLVAERTAKYSAAKALGDLAFPNGLIRDVWDLSYAIAVSGNASANTTLAQARSDVDINAAAQAWNGRGALRPPPNLLQPDPTRGRQADFICHWGAVSVNVHVDSTQRH
jgi:hypothetical protein